MKDIEYEIKNGNIAYSITKPYSYLWFNFAACFGVIGGNIFLTTFFALVTAFILVGTVKFSFIAIILGLVLLLFGFILNTLAILIIGLSSFWTEDISAYRWIYDKLLWVVGGIFLPASLIPEKFRTFTELLPFNQMFYAPARIMIEGDASLFLKYFSLQIFWIVVFGLILSLIYRRGIKQISINGG